MSLSKIAADVLASTVSGWFRNSCGTSALDVARDLSLDHAVVMRTLEQLVSTGHGSMNKDVQLYQLSFDTENISAGFKHEPIVTHIFFPSKQVLRDAFYSSQMPQQNLAEYTTRLHLGAQQIALVHFNEEVLARYLDHPELYEINDSLAGGDVSSLSNTPDDRYLYVRYGKRRLKSGHIAVTAIYKDLADMGKSEQRYWHSHELDVVDPDKSDPHFQDFLARAYEGEFVDFEDPITRLREAIVAVNTAVGPNALFAKIKNVHLRLPVEQTYKSHCDAASELYKIVGPDNLAQGTLKSILSSDFSVAADAFVHSETKRPLSSLQLLEKLELELKRPLLITGPLRALSKLRIAADHKILEPEPTGNSYSREFANICNGLSQALEEFAKLLADRAK